jgi:hypothetical protein
MEGTASKVIKVLRFPGEFLTGNTQSLQSWDKLSRVVRVRRET